MILYKSTVAEVSATYRKTEQYKAKLSKSQEVFEFLKNIYNKDTINYTESSFAIFLNRQNNTIAYAGLSNGGTTGCFIDSKVLFGLALNVGAHFIIIAHNHPSGEIQPSKADIEITRQIKEAGAILGILLLDHLIVTEERYYSFMDEGML